MWLNEEKTSDAAVSTYRTSLLGTSPNHIVIDGLFNETKLDDVVNILQHPNQWQTQKHTYSALYVKHTKWQITPNDQRFVKRDIWQRDAINSNVAHEFLSFLRDEFFLLFLSRIFRVKLTDKNVANSNINTNYFRLDATDFVRQHADDSPGREVCMLLYLNKDWDHNAGGELVFMGDRRKNIVIPPFYNRCVLFNPFSKGSEHWVKKLNSQASGIYRYNMTSWYWSE